MRLLKFENIGCQPCQMVSQFLDSKGVAYERIIASDHPKIATSYGIMSVPVTILLDDNDNEVQRSRGFNPPELEQMISQL